MRNITFMPGAYNDYIDWLTTDKKLFIKITSLIREAAKTPGEGTGKPELLKHEYSGHWARRKTWNIDWYIKLPKKPLQSFHAGITINNPPAQFKS